MSSEGHKWKVLLDAAAFAPTQPLDLSQFPADFVAVSFYKMFGFPTGLGALLVRPHSSQNPHFQPTASLCSSYFSGLA